MPKDKIILLVGLMGSGKTSVGKRLARKLALPFVDGDSEIEKAAGLSLVDVLKCFGEQEYRAGEERVMKRLLQGEPCVLASGGGSFVAEQTRKLAKQYALTIWLKADIETLYQRTAGRTRRPFLLGDNATVKTCIILFSKESVDLNTIILIDYNGKVFSKMGYSLTYDSIKKFDNYPFSFDRNINLSKVASIKLGDIAGFSLGIKTSNDKKFISNIPFKEDCYHLIRGRNIQRYNTPISDEWIWYRPDLFMEKVGAGPRRIEYFTTSPKILIQDIATEICATIDENKYLCNDTINLIYKLNKGYSFQYILGLLNSKAVRFWHKKVFPEGLHIKIYQLKEIPIPSIKEEEQKPFIMLVNQILAIKRRNISEDTSDLESEIDHLVYNLYGLTEEEIEIIEGCE